MKRWLWTAQAALLGIVVVVGTPALAADATLDQVYQAVHAGRLSEAQAMMDQVLRDHPNSAKAHYVDAEILAREGRAAQAQGELNRAEQLEPGLPSISAASVQELRSLIASNGVRQAPFAPRVAPAAAGAFPWGLVLILLIGGLVVYAVMRARRSATALPYSGGAAAPGYGTPAPYGAPPMAPLGGGGIGSGIVGGLVTGAAVGAGMVAGEALAHDLMDGHPSSRDARMPDTPAQTAADDLGGQDFGISDAGSWDDGGGSDSGGGSDWN